MGNNLSVQNRDANDAYQVFFCFCFLVQREKLSFRETKCHSIWLFGK